MHGYERIRTFLQGGEVDHLPAMPITMQFASALIGRPYLVYVTDYRVLVEGQLAVAEAFGLEHVSVISDPAREAGSLGAGVVFPEDGPPAMDEARALVTDAAVLATLALPDPEQAERMRDRLEAVRLLRERVGGRLLVEGWVEGPCAEAADIRGINALMTDFLDDPDFVEKLFAFATEVGIEFARAQVRAGADIIGVGDAAASLVGPALYKQFVLPQEKRLVDAIHGMGALVRLHICGNTTRITAGMGSLGCDIVDLDYPCAVAGARAAMGPGQALLGNIDPVRVLRDSGPVEVTAALAACHADAGPRYIVGAGCEVPRDTPHANLRALLDYALSTGPDQL